MTSPMNADRALLVVLRRAGADEWTRPEAERAH
jgi:hypothetical protein